MTIKELKLFLTQFPDNSIVYIECGHNKETEWFDLRPLNYITDAEDDKEKLVILQG